MAVANLRIHVERAMRRVREFGILSQVWRISQLPVLDDVLFCCAMLCNFQPPIMGTDFEIEGVPVSCTLQNKSAYEYMWGPVEGETWAAAPNQPRLASRPPPSLAGGDGSLSLTLARAAEQSSMILQTLRW